MAFEMDLPEDMDTGGSFLNEPGKYHMAVLAVDEQPTNRKGGVMDGFKVHCCAMDGTVAGQAKKEVELMFFAPDLTKSQKSIEMKRRQMSRFASACGILPQAAPGQRVTVDLQQAVGQIGRAHV